MPTRDFDIAHLNGSRISYTVQGEGEPVLLMHGAGLADFMDPLVDHPALDGFQVISYHRAGYGHSSRDADQFTVADHMAQAVGLLDLLGVESAHVVGHSFGGLVATALATRWPEAVRSLALLEPLHMEVPAAEELALRVVLPALSAYHAEDPSRAVDLFLSGVASPQWRQVAFKMLPPGAHGQAVADADTLFTVEMPAGLGWRWNKVAAIAQPLLLMLGERSGSVTPVYPQAHAALREQFPHAEEYTVPGATHLLQLENPTDVAERLAVFFGGVVGQ